MVHYFPTAMIIMISKQILQHSCNSDSFYQYDISQTQVFISLYTNTGKQNQPTCTQRGSIYMFYNNHLHRWRMYFFPSNYGTLFHPLSHSLSSAMFHPLDYHFPGHCRFSCRPYNRSPAPKSHRERLQTVRFSGENKSHQGRKSGLKKIQTE